MSSNSITPRCADAAASELCWVCTTMSSATGVVQEATGLRCPSTSTEGEAWRQAPTVRAADGRRTGDLDAGLFGGPDDQGALRTSISVPSMVRCVVEVACGRRERSSCTCLPLLRTGLGVIERATAAGDVLLVLAAEVLERGGDR